MGQIMYHYPAMLGTAESMDTKTATFRSVGGSIASEQGALAANWNGDTGMSYQTWQTQWNEALNQLCVAYNGMTQAHRNNTTTMMARDQAEGAKWA